MILVVGDSVYAKELASKKVARPKIRRTKVDDVDYKHVSLDSSIQF